MSVGRAVATLVLVAAAVVHADDVVGPRVYAERCAPCHGDDGAGDGPAAAALTPRPRNFRDPAFWRGQTADGLRAVVQRGRPGTLMAAFQGVLSDAEIDAVVAYLEHFRPAGARPGDGQGAASRTGEDPPRAAPRQ